MSIKSIFGLVSGGFSSALTGAIPYLLAGSLILGTTGGFYAGSVWYGNKYKGELATEQAKTASVQSKYDGFRIGALANANEANDKYNKLQQDYVALGIKLKEEHDARVALEHKKSDGLKDGLRNAKDGTLLSDSAIAYFKRLRDLGLGK